MYEISNRITIRKDPYPVKEEGSRQPPANCHPPAAIRIKEVDRHHQFVAVVSE